MDDLLTTRQVQDLLKVDRITIYRMLQDGRLKGIKIGQQWRFPAAEVNRLFSPESAPVKPADTPVPSPRRFPVHCAQVIQDLYAGLGKVGALTVSPEGVPLTETSHPCAFCSLVQSSAKGYAACQQSWQEMAQQGTEQKGPTWRTCHAGLHYQVAAIHEQEHVAAYVLSGPFYFLTKERSPEKLTKIARDYDLDPTEVAEAAQCVPLLDAERREEIESWPALYTQAIESILNERAALVTRLQKIAVLSLE